MENAFLIWYYVFKEITCKNFQYVPFWILYALKVRNWQFMAKKSQILGPLKPKIKHISEIPARNFLTINICSKYKTFSMKNKESSKTRKTQLKNWVMFYPY